LTAGEWLDDGDHRIRVNRLNIIHQAEPYQHSPAFVASRRRRRSTAKIFRAAVRHSRRVRIARVAVPIVAVAVLIGVLLAAWFNPLRLIGGLPFSLRDVVISGSKIRMEQPRLSGFTRDARPYDLSADAAAQDIRRPELVELTKLRAKIQMHDATEVELTAATGVFDTRAEILTLENNIVVRSTSGYEGQLSQAVVNTRTGNVVSDKPVTLRLLNGVISANAMEIEQAGELVRFDRGVAMLLMPNKDQGGPVVLEQEPRR
jgi:lipopolysaccharide export system protein LptC